MASIKLLEGVPVFLMTEPGKNLGDFIHDVRVDRSLLQPVFTNDETELSRLVGEMTLIVGVLEDGSREVVGHNGAQMVKAPFLVGVVVFTETRIVGVMAAGDFFAGVTFQADRDGRVVVFEVPYEQIAAIELETKAKMLGGTKPIGLMVHVRNPYLAALRLKVKGETTLAKQGRRIDDLPRRFERIAGAIAHHSRPYAYPEARAEIDRYLATGARSDEEGNLIALFEPDDWTGAAPAMELEPPGGESTVSAAAASVAAGQGRLAGFCGDCGAAFSGEETTCVQCGAPRRRK